MKFKRAAAIILSIILLFCTEVFARDRSTYDYLTATDSEILTRLRDGGLTNTRINEFLTAMDNEADRLKVPEDREVLEEYFLVILFNVVLADEEFADVCGVFDVAFQDEMNYIVENDMALPESFNEFFMSVMYNAVKPDIPDGGGEDIPPEPDDSTPPDSPNNPADPDTAEEIFLDINEAPWAKPYIISLAKNGFVDGYLGKIFRPNGKITRAELAKTVCKAFLSDKHTVSKSSYNDINDDLWYSDYAKICEYYSIFDTICTDKFGGGEYVTRQEMCTVIYRAFLNSHRTLESYPKEEFLDSSSLAPYALLAVEKLHSAGIIDGFEDFCFHPLYETTRAEMCKVIDLLLKGNNI